MSKTATTSYVPVRTKKIVVVLIGGKAFSGKTTAANYLAGSMISKLPPYIYGEFSSVDVIQTAFASKIKEIARTIFKWDGKKDPKGRRLLQLIGTDIGRWYDQDVWVKHTEQYITDNLGLGRFAFIDDWRYPNERDYFIDRHFFDVTTIRVERDGAGLKDETSLHPSETSLPSAEKENLEYNNSIYNFTIFNNGSLNEFYKKLGNVVSYLETKIIKF